MTNNVDKAWDILSNPIEEIKELGLTDEELEEVIDDAVHALELTSQCCRENLIPNTDLCNECKEHTGIKFT